VYDINDIPYRAIDKVTVMLEEAAVDCRASKPVMIAGKVIRPCVAAIIYDEDAIVHFRTQYFLFLEFVKCAMPVGA
jgi:hypothetical protein